MNVHLLILTLCAILCKIDDLNKGLSESRRWDTDISDELRGSLARNVAASLPKDRNKSTYGGKGGCMVILVLILGGDIEKNPGPKAVKFPCTLCKKEVKKNHKALKCGECKKWNHIECTEMSEEKYQEVATTKPFVWICGNKACQPTYESTQEQGIPTSPNRYELREEPKRQKKEKGKLKKAVKCKQNTQQSKENRMEIQENKFYLNQLPRISKEGYEGKEYCTTCWTTIRKSKVNIKCWKCRNSQHKKCCDMDKNMYEQYRRNRKQKWYCRTCRTSEDNNHDRAKVTKLKPEEAPATMKELKEGKSSDDYLVLHMNCRSINQKIEEILTVLEELKPDILCLTETWMDSSNPKQTLETKDYKVLRKDRTEGFKQLYGKSNGGGLVIIHKRNQKIKVKNLAEEDDEALWIQVESSNPFMLGLIYRASYTNMLRPEEGQTSLGKMLEKASLITQNIITIGDFNCDTSASAKSDETKQLEDLHEIHNLHQQITAPTRITEESKSTIDHIWTNPQNNLVKATGTVIGISDHLGIYAKLDTKRTIEKTTPIKFRSYKNYDAEKLKDDIREGLLQSEVHSKISEGKLNEALEELTSIIVKETDKHAPMKEIKQSKEKPYVPWMTPDIKNEREAKNILIKMNYLQPKQSDKQEIKRLKNKLNHTKRKHKRAYYKKKLAEFKGDSKNTWKVFKEMLNKQEIKETIEPELMDQDKANRYNNYFATIGTEIKNKLGIIDTVVNYKEGFTFSEVSEDTVAKLIDKIRIGVATGADGISARILKDCKEVILPTLTSLVNLSFRTSTFPETMKEATIKCLHKKNSTEEPSNYRPLSILPILSKVFERAAVDQIVTFLETNKLISRNQHAYRKGHSTVTSLSEVTNYIYREMDKGQIVGMASLDLSKAFDSISHSHLLQKLTNIGLGQSTVEWTKSYLSKRTQKTKFSSITSETATVTSGVPQGSILGPILFIIFTNDLITAFKNDTQVVSYADDTQLLETGKTVEEVKEKLEKTIDIAQKWYKNNSLMSNPAKTEVIIFRTKKGKKHNITIKVEENGKVMELKPAECLKILGVHVDECLDFTKQVKHVQGKATAATKNLYRIKDLLPTKYKMILYDGLIASHFNYADIIWGGCTKKNQEKLQTTQNFAMRTILGTDRRSSAKEALEKLRYLNLQNKRQVHEAVFAYKAVNQTHPEEVSKKYNELMPTGNTRSATRLVLNYPKHKTTLYERSPLYRTITTWNKLPTEIKTTPAESFKKQVQKYKINSMYGEKTENQDTVV